MQQLLLCFIFIGLGVGLYRDKKKAIKQFETAKAYGILFSEEQESRVYRLLQKGQLALSGIMALYLLASVFIPLSQTPILILLLIFLGTYYAMYYCVNEEWFFDEEGLWSSHQKRRIGFENIVGYEWRDYKNCLILRVRYKGRGIMLLGSDYEAQLGQKEAITKLMNQRMAGI